MTEDKLIARVLREVARAIRIAMTSSAVGQFPLMALHSEIESRAAALDAGEREKKDDGHEAFVLRVRAGIAQAEQQSQPDHDSWMMLDDLKEACKRIEQLAGQRELNTPIAPQPAREGGGWYKVPIDKPPSLMGYVASVWLPDGTYQAGARVTDGVTLTREEVEELIQMLADNGYGRAVRKLRARLGTGS